jgi:hypothetical protein
MIALLIQYFRKGFVVAAKKRKCLLKRINVEIFQLMINIPIEAPTIAELKELTFPRYSGARYKEKAPNVFIKVPFTVLKRMNQNTNKIWYFLKWRKTNWIGKEYKNPRNQAFMK